MRHLTFLFLLIGILGFSQFSPRSAAAQEEGNFQIMKATADKVWRLNKNTGEIAICRLDGDRMVCASSTEAMRAPAISYEQREAERKRLQAEKNAQDLALLDRILTAVRVLIGTSIEQSDETAK